MREKLKLEYRPWGQPKQEAVVEVEYREVPHFYSDVTERGLKQYEVLVDGEVVGKVHSFEYDSHTTYAHSRIRRDLGRPKRWAWSTFKPNPRGRKTNWPGLYANTRRGAVADMLGFDQGRAVK